MVDALNSAANGLLNAQKRATDLAVEILKSTTGQGDFKKNLNQNLPDDSAAAEDTPPQTANPNTPPATERRASQGSGVLVQHITDFKAAELQFKASAAAFTRMADTEDQAIGTLIDDEG